MEDLNGASAARGAAPRRRLIVLSEFVDAAQNSTGYYWARTIESLAPRFAGLRVICPRSSRDRIAHPAAGVTYVTFEDRPFDKNRLAARFLGQCVQTLQFSRAVIAEVKAGDVVFSGTNPSLSVLVLALLKRFIGFRWILLVHDVFPENLAAAGVVRPGGSAYSLLKWCFDRAYAAADTLIGIGRDMCELLREKSGRNRVVFIPNWVDPGDVEPQPRDAAGLLQSTGWDDRVVFQFFGNMGRTQGLDNILDALRRVGNRRAAFVLIGAGSEENTVARFVADNPGLDILRVPQLPFSQNNAGLSACDVAIVSLGEGMRGLAVPSKAYFSLAADKPLLIVSDEGSELHRLWGEEAAVGWFCRCAQPAELARLIDDISGLDLSRRKGAAREVLIRKYGRAEAVRRYAECIRELQDPARGP